MKKIFICYRTVDEPYAATLIDRVLVPRFGSDTVFRASRSIRVGDDFEQKIFEAIRAASVLLVVIGSHWLDARDEHGRRRDDPKDLVRREILTAFEHGVRVVLVLMNTRRPLPEEMQVYLMDRGEDAAKAITQIAELLISSMIKSGESMAQGNSGLILPDKSQVPTGVSAYNAGDFV